MPPQDQKIASAAGAPEPFLGGLRDPAASWRHYATSVALVGSATLLSELLRGILSLTNLLMVFLFAVIVAALLLGRGPAILASVLGAVAFDFFLVPPYYTFAVDDAEYLLTMLGLFAVGVVISTLTERYRLQAQTAERRASETATLNALSRDLAAAVGREAIARAIIDNITTVFGREVAVLLADKESSRLKLQAASTGFVLDDFEHAVAAQAYASGQATGRATGLSPEARARYLPLQTASGKTGVLGVKPVDPGTHLTADQRRLLEAFASLAALALERARLAEEAESARIQMEGERTRSSLLSSVSHDLRTPLAAITGAASSLVNDGAAMDAGTRHDLAQSIYDEANRLNVLLRNLLDMTRLESGAIRVEKAWQPLEEVVGAVLDRMEPLLAGRPVEVHLPADLPLVPLDEVFIDLVLVNLLENAAKYTPPESPIAISAWDAGGAAVVEVADRGPGLTPGDEQRVFDKFYRAPSAKAGVGLGLAICRGIIHAHNGRIWAENRPGGGAAFRFTLPFEGEPPDSAGPDWQDQDVHG